MAYTLPWWQLTLAMTLAQTHNPCSNTLCTNPWPLHQPLDTCANPWPCVPCKPVECGGLLEESIARIWCSVHDCKGSLQGFDTWCITARVQCKDLMHSTSLQGFSARVGAHINRISVKKDRKTSKNIKIWPFLTWFWLVQGSRVKGWCTHYHRIRVKKDRKPSKNIKIWPFLTIVQSLVLCNHFPTSIYSQVTHFPHTHVIP
jgi:hypothetical protein